MKIKALASLCSKAKQIILYDDGGQQWAGDGMAAYLLPGAFGRLNTGALTAIFDIPADKAADMLIRNIDMPAGYDTEDEGDGETELDFDTDCRILHNGRDMVPCKTPDGKVYLIQAKYIKPLTDCDGLRLSLRHMSGDGRPYITAKDGMFLTAIIMPITLGEPLSAWMYTVYNGAVKARSYEGGELNGEEPGM